MHRARNRYAHEDLSHCGRAVTVMDVEAAFMKSKGRRRLVAGMPHVQEVLQRHDIRLPLASLLLHQGS